MTTDSRGDTRPCADRTCAVVCPGEQARQSINLTVAVVPAGILSARQSYFSKDLYVTVKPDYGLRSLDVSSPPSAASSQALTTLGTWGFGATGIRTTIVSNGTALRVNFTLPLQVFQYQVSFNTLGPALQIVGAASVVGNATNGSLLYVLCRRREGVDESEGVGREGQSRVCNSWSWRRELEVFSGAIDVIVLCHSSLALVSDDGDDAYGR